MTTTPHADCDPTWSDNWKPSDRTPTPFDLRQAEMCDLRDQGAGPLELRTADNIPTSHYL